MKKQKKKTAEIAKNRLTKTVRRDRALRVSSRKIARSICLSGILLVGMQSCGGFYIGGGTTAGIRANNDLVTGTINETKTPAGKKGSHYQLRKIQAKKGTFLTELKRMFVSSQEVVDGQ